MIELERPAVTRTIRLRMNRLAVVHLIRKKNGIEPVRHFLRSYQARDPGMEHDLIFILKGFPNDFEREPYRELLDTLRHETLCVPDRGYDVAPYQRVAERFDYEHFCFLNSFSSIRAECWLAKLYKGVTRKGVGLAGATGSYQSFRPTSWAPYLEISRQFKRRGPVKDIVMALPFSYHLNFLLRTLLFGPGFHRFPNYHVRSNAFIVGRDLMRHAVQGVILTKMDAYRFESGRRGLTAQVLQMGLEAVVVGADGECYSREDWPLSNTFWQSRQENLLVADNQTRRYSHGPREVRDMLAHIAWGDDARPG